MMRQIIPSMFSRRLLLLAVGAFAVVGLLVAQLTRLTVAEASVWREKAEAVLVNRRLIPTARGQILDRRMRVLAVDKPGYDICVRYPVITGDWAYRQGRRAAYRANRDQWQQIDDDQRHQLIAQYQRSFNQQVQDLWQALSDLEPGGRERLEEQKDVVIRRVKQTASVVWVRRLERRLEEEQENISLADVSQPIGEQLAAHPLLTNVDSLALVRVRSLMARAIHDPQMGGVGTGQCRSVSVPPVPVRNDDTRIGSQHTTDPIATIPAGGGHARRGGPTPDRGATGYLEGRRGSSALPNDRWSRPAEDRFEWVLAWGSGWAMGYRKITRRSATRRAWHGRQPLGPGSTRTQRAGSG